MKKHITLSLIALFISAGIALAQKHETRSVGTFSRLSFGFPGKLILRQGTPQKIELEGNEDVLSRVETEVDGDRLTISQKGMWKNWTNNDRIIVYVTVEKIEGISVSGSGDVIAETKIISNELDLRVSGSGSLTADIDVAGEVEGNVSGSGNIELKGMQKL